MLAAAGQGHIGPAFSLVEILRVLYDDVMKYDPTNPRWEERDRLILSKGHGYLSLYAMLVDKGFFPNSELDKFCQAGAMLGVHPSRHIPGVEFDTGSLGHGLSLGAGIAKAKPDRRVYVVIGDGECDEGQIWEAALYAAKHKLDNLTVMIDCNGMQASGKTKEVQPLEPLIYKWQGFEWGVLVADGHSVNEIKTKLGIGFYHMPLVLICQTIKGKGATMCENNPTWHHKSRVTPEEVQALYDGLEVYPCAPSA
jgi:transketolase